MVKRCLEEDRDGGSEMGEVDVRENLRSVAITCSTEGKPTFW